MNLKITHLGCIEIVPDKFFIALNAVRYLFNYIRLEAHSEISSIQPDPWNQRFHLWVDKWLN